MSRVDFQSSLFVLRTRNSFASLSAELNYFDSHDKNENFDELTIFPKYNRRKWYYLKIRETIFWMFPNQPPTRCSLYGFEKSIYRSPRSLLVVVLRSSRGESILQRDVEKRDVDTPRDREYEKGEREQRRSEATKREGQKVPCIHLYVYARVCLYVNYKRYWRIHHMKRATPSRKWRVIWKYSPPTSSRITDRIW